MQHIEPEVMSPPVRKLWEISSRRGLSPEALAPMIGVSFMSIYRWFRGAKPLAAHVALILLAVSQLGE